jgi:hypothetical protein
VENLSANIATVSVRVSVQHTPVFVQYIEEETSAVRESNGSCLEDVLL